MAHIYEGNLIRDVEELQRKLGSSENGSQPPYQFSPHGKMAVLAAALIMGAALSGCTSPLDGSQDSETSRTSTEQLPPTFNVDWRPHYKDGSEGPAPIKECPEGNYTAADWIKFLVKFDDPNGLKSGLLRLYHQNGERTEVFAQDHSYDGTPLAKPPKDRGADSDKVNFLLGEGDAKPGTLLVSLDVEDQLGDVKKLEYDLDTIFIPPGQKAPCE